MLASNLLCLLPQPPAHLFRRMKEKEFETNGPNAHEPAQADDDDVGPADERNDNTQSTTQQPGVFSPPPPEIIAALVAASKTSSTPSPVRLLHSRYFLAPIASRISSPILVVQNPLPPRFRISSCATASSLRSFFSATRMTGTSGQRSLASSAHLSLTLESESGESTEKPIRITCALE